MSEETPPPAKRVPLRPARPAISDQVASLPPAPAPEPPSPDANGPKMRLRPRVAAEPAPVSVAPPPPALFIDPPASVSPATPGVIPPPASEEKFKLRVKPALGPASQFSPPPFPLVAAADAPAPGHGPDSVAPPSHARSWRVGLLAAGLLVLGGGLFFALRPLRLPPPVAPTAPAKISGPPPTPAPAPAPAPVGGLVQAPAVAAASALPVKANAAETTPPSVSVPPPLPPPAPVAPAPGMASVDSAASSAVAATPIAPGVAAAIDLEVSGNPSSAFRSFVVNAAIRGVIGGQSPKALINGKLVHLGEFADSAQGIVLAEINAAEKTLRFRDSTGATVIRRY